MSFDCRWMFCADWPLAAEHETGNDNAVYTVIQTREYSRLGISLWSAQTSGCTQTGAEEAVSVSVWPGTPSVLKSRGAGCFWIRQFVAAESTKKTQAGMFMQPFGIDSCTDFKKGAFKLKTGTLLSKMSCPFYPKNQTIPKSYPTNPSTRWYFPQF